MARFTDSEGNLLGGINSSLPSTGDEATSSRSGEATPEKLLERVYSLASGDTHRPVDLQSAGQELGLTTQQIMPLFTNLMEQGYLSAVKEPDRMALYLTPQAVKKVTSVQTRR